MTKRIAGHELTAIVAAVGRNPDGLTTAGIREQLSPAVSLRTLQYRLKRLVAEGRLVMDRQGRQVRYRPGSAAGASHAAQDAPLKTTAVAVDEPTASAIPLSTAGRSIRDHLRRAIQTRPPIGYDHSFLERYRPNVTAYLTTEERAHLRDIGTPRIAAQPAGTYARQIFNRLLIDLAWNSSRLEGNTYSLLDTRRLIEFGEEAEGRTDLEAQMILNHKDAIEFLVSATTETGFNRYTLLNLHGLLANNLLPDPAAAGRLRHIAVGIEGSSFQPLDIPQRIEECFDRILATAGAIGDPFEQSFFLMVHLPYLQPFDDVNKRVSRLAANIPFIQHNLAPLSFADVPRQTYTEAILGIYELTRIDYLKDVFLWAYERSAERYAAVRQSLGEPDPFRLRYRTELREVVASVIRAGANRRQAARQIFDWSTARIDDQDRQRFIDVAEAELLALHEGNFARYQIRPSEFAAWRQIWSSE